MADNLCDDLVTELARYGIVAAREREGESEFIGFESYQHKMWRPARPKFWRLVYALEHVVDDRPPLTGEELGIILGHIVCQLLLRRDVLSIFSAHKVDGSHCGGQYGEK